MAKLANASDLRSDGETFESSSLSTRIKMKLVDHVKLYKISASCNHDWKRIIQRDLA